MRKFIIYCLVAVMMVALVPTNVKANSTESEVYEVTIYPNRRQLFSFDNDDLVLGDVKVSYDVDYDNDEVDIYFEKPIFIDDVISKGDTLHKNIIFNDDEIEVNKDLDTSGFMSPNVSSLKLKYESVENVDSITIKADSTDEEDWIGLLEGKTFFGTDRSWNKNNGRKELFELTDNDLNTYVKCVPNYRNTKYFSNVYSDLELDLGDNYNISGFRLKSSTNTSYIGFYDSEKKVIEEKPVYYFNLNGEINNVNLGNVRYIKIRSDDDNSFLKIYEFEVYNIELSEISNLQYNVNNGNVILNWINPDNEHFAGINIYRNDVLIAGNIFDTSYIDTEVNPGNIVYKITTLDSRGYESPGTTINVFIESPPEEVIGLDYSVEGNNVTFTWTNPDTIDSINIYRDGKLIDTTTEELFSESLSPGTYQYRITTIESGRESPGITIDVSIMSLSPPTTVKNVRITNRTSTGGLVTWTENPTYENVEKYIVYVNGEKHGEIESPPYPLEGLEEGKTYNIGVRAINSYGMSEPPATIIFTPTKLAEIGNSIKIGDIFAYISMLFSNMWPLLALALAIIISPKIYNLIKTNVT